MSTTTSNILSMDHAYYNVWMWNCVMKISDHVPSLVRNIEKLGGAWGRGCQVPM